MDEDKGVDKAGADNMLCGPISTGFGTSGWNTSTCSVEKWDGEPLEEDVKWPQRIIF
jgi:anaerobic dimethyl sulfoxide reductase subunit A